MSEPHDFKPPAGGASAARRPRMKPLAMSRGEIDIRAALEAPVRLKKDGAVRAVHPFEAVLRQHVRKALVEKSVPSIQYLLAQAEKLKLIKTPPEQARGGVFTVPKGLPEEIERQIFGGQDGSETTMEPVIHALLRVVSVSVIARCFRGRR